MILRVICREVECASRTDGGRQRLPDPNNPAWKGQTEAKGELAHPRMRSQAKHATDLNGLSERPDEVKQAEQPEEEWEAMQMDDEEDPWAGQRMDGAGEIPSGISTNVESQAEDAVDPQEELSELRVEIDDNGDGIEELRRNLPHEEERPTENVTGKKWGCHMAAADPGHSRRRYASQTRF